MRRARDLVMAVAMVVLGGGYLASQWAAQNGTASEVAVKLDQAPIRILATLLVVATVVLAVLPDHKESA